LAVVNMISTEKQHLRLAMQMGHL